jgi:predicted MarR family transcription regulator
MPISKAALAHGSLMIVMAVITAARPQATAIQLAPGPITYDLRRLRLHGLIERIPKNHRYRVTAKGLRIAAFYTRLYIRSLRTGLAIISPDPVDVGRSIAKSIRAAERAINTWYDEENLAA